MSLPEPLRLEAWLLATTHKASGDRQMSFSNEVFMRVNFGLMALIIFGGLAPTPRISCAFIACEARTTNLFPAEEMLLHSNFSAGQRYLPNNERPVGGNNRHTGRSQQ